MSSSKKTFIEVLIISLCLFLLGILIGNLFENKNVEKINQFYLSSEISLSDQLALLQLENISCTVLKENNVNLANKIYEDAWVLEKYENSGKLTDTLRLVHKKYDLLRTFLWINNYQIFERCDQDFDLVVYLYEYNPEELAEIAEQKTWSKVLGDLKDAQGDTMVLIPIAVNMDITSLEVMLTEYEIPSYPAVIINNKEVITELKSVTELREYLTNQEINL